VILYLHPNRFLHGVYRDNFTLIARAVVKLKSKGMLFINNVNVQENLWAVQSVDVINALCVYTAT
jgi:hypothetical protein